MVAGKALCTSCTLLQMGLTAWWSTASGSGRWSKWAFIKRATSNFVCTSTAALVPSHRGRTAVAAWASQGNSTLHYSHSSDFNFQFENRWNKRESADPPVLQPFAGTEYYEIDIIKILLLLAFWKTWIGSWWTTASQAASPTNCFLFMLCQLGPSL